MSPHVISTKRYLVACAAIALAWVLTGCASGLRIDQRHSSVNQDSRVQFLVLHYTQGSFDDALKVLTEPSDRAVSSHYLVRDLPVQTYQLVDENRRAWHAGASFWKGHTHLNASSIGIEIVNPGWVLAADGSRQYVPYSEAQMDEVVALCRDIVDRHHIRPEHIVGHSDIAPGRKHDPGPLFPWKRLADAGLVAWPDAKQVARRTAAHARQLPDAGWFQEKLAEVGYGTSRSGSWDALTRDSLAAFQMKYRATQFDGLPDAETAALLEVVTDPEGMVGSAARSVVATPAFTVRW